MKAVTATIALLFFAGVGANDKTPVENDDPPSETEIICFAAKEKWVCAPASDQQQAHRKALRLIDEEDQEKFSSSEVEIVTIPEQQALQVIEEPISELLEASESESLESSTTAEALSSPNKGQKAGNDEGSATVGDTISQYPTNAESLNMPRSDDFSNWRQQHPEAWALQLVGTTNLPNLENFINQHEITRHRFAIATTEVKGAPWHIVLLGVFASRDEAVQYRNLLNNDLQSAWARPIAGIELLDQ